MVRCGGGSDFFFMKKKKKECTSEVVDAEGQQLREKKNVGILRSNSTDMFGYKHYTNC